MQVNLCLLLANLVPLLPLDGSSILKDTLLLRGWSAERTAKWLARISIVVLVFASSLPYHLVSTYLLSGLLHGWLQGRASLLHSVSAAPHPQVASVDRSSPHLHALRCPAACWLQVWPLGVCLWSLFETDRLLQFVMAGMGRAHPYFAFSSSDWERRLAAKSRKQRGDSANDESTGGTANSSASEEFVPFGGAGHTLGGRASTGAARRRWAAMGQQE